MFYVVGHGVRTFNLTRMALLISAAGQTSDSTPCFALNMLAVHQEEQQALYRHIRDILPDGRLQ